MKKSHLLIQENPLQVLPKLATIIGLDEAIIIQQLHYWIENTKSEGRIDEEGNKWVYNTYAEWKENNFPFWSEDKIQKIFLSLEKQGVVISAQLDAKKRDMRKFYRIAYDQLCAMDDAFLRPSNTANPHDVKMNQRLPENTTDNKSESKKEKDPVDTLLDFEKMKQGNEEYETQALHDFERIFGFGELPWYSNTTWDKFRKWIVKQAAAGWFADYVKWREGDGKYKHFSNKKIRENPAAFMDTGYPEYEASKMYRKTDNGMFRTINR